MTKYDLYKIVKEELRNGSCDLVTRTSGQRIRDRIERDITREEDKTVVVLDFSKIGIIDYSCADEVVAKLISRLLGGEYGDKYIILKGLNENQRENIEVALERKSLAVMADMKNEGKILLGCINNYLRQTLDLILEKERITAKELSDALHLEANTSGTRLLNLHKKRLVQRTEKLMNGVRVWMYESV